MQQPVARVVQMTPGIHSHPGPREDSCPIRYARLSVFITWRTVVLDGRTDSVSATNHATRTDPGGGPACTDARAVEGSATGPVDATLPRVTVIVPIRNEADFIESCVNSIRRSDYPGDRLQIIVVDGMSSDGSPDLVQRLAREDSRIQLFENPDRIVPRAMNLALRNATGDIIVRIDGHTEVPDWFISRSVTTLMSQPGCWCAGGAIETVSQTFVGRVIAACMASPVGVGNARFRLGGFDGNVDTLAFGAYWKWVFDRLGGFDEELVCNQDDEFNARLIAAGGRIYQSSAISSRYYSRTTLSQLARQYFRYGYWRIRTIQKLGRPATVRQMIPMLFVLTLTGLIVSALLWPPSRIVLWSVLVAYAVTLLLGAIQVARRLGVTSALLSPVVFLILHLAYGIGCCCGLVRFGVLNRKQSPPGTRQG